MAIFQRPMHSHDRTLSCDPTNLGPAKTDRGAGTSPSRRSDRRLQTILILFLTQHAVPSTEATFAPGHGAVPKDNALWSNGPKDNVLKDNRVLHTMS